MSTILQVRKIKAGIKQKWASLPGVGIKERRKIKASIKDDWSKIDTLRGKSKANSEDSIKQKISEQDTDFGLQSGTGKVTREKLNAAAQDVLKKHDAGIELTKEDIETIRQYSGKGGLTEGSQYEYYTPTHVAAGMYDLMAINGLSNGNLLETSAGAGVFGSEKPKGFLITGAEIDKTSSSINQILHPEDNIMNTSFEDLVMSSEGVYFDAVIGNIPFGDQRGEFARKDPSYKNEKSIDRYFIHRAIDKAKPGGLICLIVPIRIVGDRKPAWIKFRSAISRKAEFLGAHKLPSKTFGRQGTDTVTDIIVLKKHPSDLLEKIDDLPLETLNESNVLWDEFIEGKYWLGEGNKFIKGKYVPPNPEDFRPQEKVIPDASLTDKGLQAKLAVKFNSRIDWGLVESVEPAVKNYVNGDFKNINGTQYEMKNGAWSPVANDESSLTIDFDDYGATDLETLKNKLSSVDGLLSVGFEKVSNAVSSIGLEVIPEQYLNAYNFASKQAPDVKAHAFRGSLIGSQVSSLAGGNHDLREGVQKLIKREFDARGHASKQNKGIKRIGAGAKDYGAFEVGISRTGELSNLVAGNLDINAAEGYDSKDVYSIVSHFFNAELEPVEVADIKRLYDGPIKINTLADLAEIDEIGIDPSGGVYPVDVYCSGEFLHKLDAMNQALTDEKDPRILEKYKSQIDRIESSRIKTDTTNIVFGMRHKWIDPKYVLEFLELSGYSSIKYEDGKWKGPRGYNPSGLQLRILRYLQGETVAGKDGTKATVYREKIAGIEAQFNNFIKTHADSVDLTENFNRTLNSYIPFEYSKDSLNLKGKSPDIEPHPYQNQAIRQLSDKGRGILGDGVGLGKTLQALALHQYDKEKGRGKRTCIVVPVSVLQNWYNEAKTFLEDTSDVLFVGFEPRLDKSGNIVRESVLDEKGKPKVNRYTGELVMQDSVKKDSSDLIKSKLRSIPQSNYSLVIMPTTRFEEIPLREDTIDDYMRDWVSRGLAKDSGKTGYARDKKKSKLKGEFSNTGKVKDEGLPYFEDMMFDKVIADEGHFFKNSYRPGTEASRIANIPNTNPSDRAADMAMKLGYVRDANGGRGTYMLTATPFTNSPVEIFNMMTMTMPMDEFEAMGIYSTDDFIKIFGKTEIKPRVTMAGDLIDSEMLTGFTNLQGLRGMFYRYAVVRDADAVKEDMQVPPHEEIKCEVSLSLEQEQIYDDLREEAQSEVEKMFNQSIPEDGEELPDDEKRHTFAILRDMERAATDLDLYYNQMTFIFELKDKSKIEAVIQDLPKSKDVKEKGPDGSMEKMHIDLDYDLTTEGDSLKLVLHYSYENDVIKGLKKHKAGSVTHPINPKYAKLIENLRNEYQAGGKQILFTEEKTQHKKLARIISHHLAIDLKEIGIINADQANGEKLQEIADLYNSGKQKIVIANKKAEVGVNLQKGTTAIHHLTFPWTPSSLEQRNGRGVRQGNTAAHINIYYYVAKRSVDTLRLDRIQGKDNWIKKMIHGEESDLEYKDENTLSNDDYLYLFSRNPEEAKARLQLEEAKALKKRKKKKDQDTVVSFSQYAEAKVLIDNFSAIKERNYKKIQDRIASLEDEITRYTRIYNERHKQVVDAKKSLQRMNIQEESFDRFYDSKYTKAKASLLQQKSYLNSLKELPFDKSLLDSPDSALVTKYGTLLVPGKFYEVKGRSEEYRNIKELLFKVVSVNFEAKTFSAEVIYGESSPFGHSVPLNEIPLYNLGETVEVSYNDNELKVKKLENEKDRTLTLESILSMGPDFINENYDLVVSKIKHSTYIIVVSESGDYELAKTAYYGDEILTEGKKLVAGIEGNETAKKQLSLQYLQEKRESRYGAWDGEAKAIFGYDWSNVIYAFGNNATKDELIDSLNKLYLSKSATKDLLSEKLKAIGSINQYRETATIDLPLVTRICKEKGWDNVKQSTEWGQEFIDGLYRKVQDEEKRIKKEVEAKKRAEEESLRLQQEAERIEREARQAAEEKDRLAALEEASRLAEKAMKAAHKEFPSLVQSKLAKLGLEVRYADINSQYKVKKDIKTLMPFSDIMIQFSNAGALNYTQKEVVKGLGYSFTKDVMNDAYKGTWWIVHNTEPQALFDAIFPSDQSYDDEIDRRKANGSAPKKLLIPYEELGPGDAIPGKDWIIAGIGKTWKMNDRSKGINESQDITFDIDDDDLVCYAYFS